jgi:hypothetical protein
MGIAGIEPTSSGLEPGVLPLQSYPLEEVAGFEPTYLTLQASA